MDFAKATLQLGMNAVTANGRLQRRVLFMLVQKAGMDTCYRCGKKIERLEDLSLDHKEPWFDIDPALYWDLDNIAFSHCKCNTEARRRVKPRWTPEQRERNSQSQKQRFANDPELAQQQAARLQKHQAAATKARLELYARRKAHG